MRRQKSLQFHRTASTPQGLCSPHQCLNESAAGRCAVYVTYGDLSQLLCNAETPAGTPIELVLGAAPAFAMSLLVEEVGITPLQCDGHLKDIFEMRSRNLRQLIHECYPKSGHMALQSCLDYKVTRLWCQKIVNWDLSDRGAALSD
jgi:hypothetical protein